MRRGSDRARPKPWGSADGTAQRESLRRTEAIRSPEKAQDRRSEPEAWLGHPSSMNRQFAILRKFAIS